MPQVLSHSKSPVGASWPYPQPTPSQHEIWNQSQRPCAKAWLAEVDGSMFWPVSGNKWAGAGSLEAANVELEQVPCHQTWQRSAVVSGTTLGLE